MRRYLIRAVTLVILMISIISEWRTVPVDAQGISGHAITRSTTAGSSYTIGVSYSLYGTAGQPEAGFIRSSPYTLTGGFWGGGFTPPGSNPVYLPYMGRY